MTPQVRLAILAVLAVAPTYLNDLLYMRAAGVSDWLLADYGSKTLVLILILAFPDTRRALAGAWTWAPFERTPRYAPLAWALAVAGVVVIAFLYLKPPLDAFAPGMKLFVYPDIDDPAVHAFDLSAGLVLTAVAEELAFRGLARRVIGAFTGNTTAITVISALAFAAIHWSNGLGSLTIAFIAGILLMALHIRSGSLWPPVIAHYLADLALFV
jgi:membrane protease YdiL (CAAX protease family)